MVAPLTSSLSLGQSIAQARDTLQDLQRQLATGKKYSTYAEMGLERTKVLSLRAELSQIKGYKDGIAQVDIRLDVMLQGLMRIRDLAAETRADALKAGFELASGGKTIYQVEVGARFDETVALLNTQVAGRYLFGGIEVERPPLAPANHILSGHGALAGFQQVADERRQADLGADGLGRLVVSPPAGGVVSVAEDAAGSPFGFKLIGVNSTLSGTAVTGPAGAPAAIDVAFGGTPPQDGQTIRLSLLLPDGTETEVTLTARAGAAGPGAFSIGADADATAANFQAALTAEIAREAQVTLRAASMFAAADDFFDFDATTPPQRVDGPPFDGATGLRDATPADTVIWYKGDLSDLPARQSAVVKADDTLLVAHGARADENGLATVLKQMAVLATATFDWNDAESAARYAEVKKRAVSELSFADGGQSTDAIVTEIAAAKSTLGRAGQRHQDSDNMLRGFLDKAESSDIYELGAQILSLQGRLEASLQIAVSLRRLALVNFL